MLSAMGSTEDAALTERARALVFEKGLLRRNEIFPIVGGQTGAEKTRPALRQWVDSHFSELEARLAPAGAALVGLYSAGMCSESEAADVESRFADRMKSIEGGPLELKQTAESIRLCSAQKSARKGMPLAFVAEKAKK
jgi:alanyl aminopeptidase